MATQCNLPCRCRSLPRHSSPIHESDAMSVSDDEENDPSYKLSDVSFETQDGDENSSQKDETSDK